MKLALNAVKNKFFIYKKFILILAFEVLFGFLLLGSIIPDNISSEKFLTDPMGLMTTDYITIGLAIGMFVPFILPYIGRLNIFGLQVERKLSEKIDKSFEQAQKNPPESCILMKDLYFQLLQP